jgi:hypothetical protein
MSGSNGYGGRMERGRFAPGNKIASGNLNAKKMHEYRQALLEAGDVATLAGIFRKLGELAMAGDTTAAKIYIEYLCGRPIQALELSGPDSEPLGINPVVEVERVLETMSIDELHRFQEFTEVFAERMAMLESL